MGLDLLDTPVRLTWDFPVRMTGQALERLPAIAGRIADGGVFFVTLQGRPLLCPVLPELLDVLAGTQRLLTCSGSSQELERLALLDTAGFQLLLDASAFVSAAEGVRAEALRALLEALRGSGCEPLLTLTPLRNNLCNIPDLVRFCVEHEVPRFKLPNAHIGDSFLAYSPQDLPRWQDLDNFRKVWERFAAQAGPLPAMEIHDLFLWEIMTPGAVQNRSEYGGCQAGNSLAHVDPAGGVHPCAAWPQQLGRLPEQSLEEIWAGDQRLAVRERIGNTPSGCRGCRDLDVCFGGCRGLARHLNRAEGERDLMCPGPR